MNDHSQDADAELAQLLRGGQPAHSRRRVLGAAAALLLVVSGGGLYAWLRGGGSPALHYESAAISRGDLTVTVTATGNLQPVNQVDVGSELSGRIEAVNVDFNDRVQHGQVLARLNTDRLRAQVLEERAALTAAGARVEEAKATVLETRLHFARCEKLSARQACPPDELDAARAAVARADAAAASARAEVEQARATLNGGETDLAKTDIRSPIDGLVLSRQIEPGQTVAASLQAPVLFTLAEDLAQMELHVAIDEADVGKAAVGQAAVFTVDAYPERSFPARIEQLHEASQTVAGVVSYEAVLSVDNAGLALRPGMTATAVITTQQRQGVVLLPNAALRFAPPVTAFPRPSGGGGRGLFGALFPGPPQTRYRAAADANTGPKVWILRDGEPVAVAVTTGPSDGRFTELESGELEPGDAVLVDAIGTPP